MSEIIADLAEQKVTPQTANAMINASGKLMKAAELQQKYGTSGSGGQDRDLLLVREQSIQ